MTALTLLTLSLFAFAQDIPLDASKLTPERRAALAKWKPGPLLSAELRSLEQQGIELFKAFNEGRLDDRALLKERSRRAVGAYVLKAWSFAVGRDEVARIAVVEHGTPEIRQVFPRGLSHLPDHLQPKAIYRAAPDESRRWQYVGERRQGPHRFIIFRLVEDEAVRR